MTETDYSDGGVVTFTIQATVSVSANNPDFTNDDVVAHAVDALSLVADYGLQLGVTFAAPFEPIEVRP